MSAAAWSEGVIESVVVSLHRPQWAQLTVTVRLSSGRVVSHVTGVRPRAIEHLRRQALRVLDGGDTVQVLMDGDEALAVRQSTPDADGIINEV